MVQVRNEFAVWIIKEFRRLVEIARWSGLLSEKRQPPVTLHDEVLKDPRLSFSIAICLKERVNGFIIRCEETGIESGDVTARAIDTLFDFGLPNKPLKRVSEVVTKNGDRLGWIEGPNFRLRTIRELD